MRTFMWAAASTVAVAGACSSASTNPVTRGDAPVASVTVGIAASSITAGATTVVTATIKDSSGNTLSNRTVAWNSSDLNVATVASDGKVLAITPGAATISATSEGHSGSIGLTVTAPPPAPVASVTITPPSPSMQAGSSTQLTATLKDAGGTVLSGRTIKWASSNTAVATVNTSGLVSAIAPGAATITATSEGKSGSSTVTVTSAPPAPVATVAVSPSNPTVQAGGNLQFSATLKDADGNVLSGRVVTWASSNTSAATVNSNGLVTAVSAGTSTITATSEAMSGSASVTVTAATQSPSCSNPGPGWVWCDDFETDRLSSYFEYIDDGGRFVRAAGVGRNGSTGMRSHFDAGTVSAGALHLALGRTPASFFKPVDAGTSDYRELYWRFYVKAAQGWSGGSGFKITRAIILAKSDWSEAAFAHVWSNAPPDPTLSIDPASGTNASGNLVTSGYNDFNDMSWLGQVSGTTPLFDAAHVGQWYCIEVHARLNDAGQSNGVFEFWINGNLEARSANLNWVGNYNAYGWNAVFLENYWNGGAPQSQDRYFDDFVIATQRIGCN